MRRCRNRHRASARMVPEAGPARAQVVDRRFRGAGAAAMLERRAPTLRWEHRPHAVPRQAVFRQARLPLLCSSGWKRVRTCVGDARHACQRSSSRLHTSAPLRSRLAAVLAKPRTPCTAVRAGHAGRARCSTARHAPRGCEGATAAAAAPGRPRSLSMRLRTRRPRTARCRRRRATSRPCSSRRAPAGVNPGISYCLRSCRRLHP